MNAPNKDSGEGKARLSHDQSQACGRRHHWRRLDRPLDGQGNHRENVSIRRRLRARHSAQDRGLRGDHGRTRLQHPSAHDAKHGRGNHHAPAFVEGFGGSGAPARVLPSRHRCRRRGRALGWCVLPLPAGCVHAAHAPHAETWSGQAARGPRGSGLGRHLRRTRTALLEIRAVDGHQRQSRQPARQEDRWRQRLRRAAPAGVPHAAAEALLREQHV